MYKHAYIHIYIYVCLLACTLPLSPLLVQDLLFFSTEHYKFCALSYNRETSELVTRAHGDLKDKTGRPSDHGQFGVIDPEARVIGLHLYSGHLKTIPIDQNGSLRDAFNVRLDELKVSLSSQRC